MTHRDTKFLGVMRKKLGLTFLGESKEDIFVTGDICLKGPSLDREVCPFSIQ
jgi:hypothetical protein